MGDSHPNTEQILLRLPKRMFEALLVQAARATTERLEKVSIQTLMREILVEYLASRDSN
jgi:hypothetical protein